MSDQVWVEVIGGNKYRPLSQYAVLQVVQEGGSDPYYISDGVSLSNRFITPYTTLTEARDALRAFMREQGVIESL